MTKPSPSGGGKQPPKPNLIKSVAGALLGVQSEACRKTDFKQPSALPFIVTGALAIVIFVGILIAISRWIAG
ncbi:hypothetical protein ABT56_05405 [Photobacterium aquae]|uniref:DUF2970 domain-containing protein n=1 Tax=Photobacterium aquae TaxID=1195763 RepID=A0A0J1H727_9GAMM|nr:DUF2970 domain-containing protein [Photobacterium aquae]KLV07501.1 hypothetical protein ABT56_05405 [Photobacterium aquae]